VVPEDPHSREALRLLGVGPADEAALRADGVGARLGEMLRAAFVQGTRGLAADIAGYSLQPWGFEPEAVQAKTLLLYGSRDPLVDPRHGRWWQSRLPDARLEVAPEAGHLLLVPMWARVLSHLAPSRGMRRPQPRSSNAAFPTTARKGRLRLARTGSVLSYHASEGPQGEFRRLQQYEFGQADLKNIRIVGATQFDLERLVDESLDYARMQDANLELELQNTDLRELYEETVNLMMPAARAKRQTLELDLPDQIPAVCVDRRRCERVAAVRRAGPSLT
jgi:hypothetical protein